MTQSLHGAPPTTTFQGVLKQLAIADLDADQRALMDICFPEFTSEAQRLAPYQVLGVEVLYTAYQPRRVGWGRLRRYAGSESFGPSRYWSVCVNDRGSDGGTLLNELMTYWGESTMVFPEVADSTNTAGKSPLTEPALILRVSRYQQRRSHLGKRPANKLDEITCTLPLSVKYFHIPNVLDLRFPETQEWFFRVFVQLEEQFGLQGQRSPGGIMVKTYKYHKLAAFTDLLPTLLVPGLGGSTFHQAVGAWLRSHEVAGFVYPSARCDVEWQILPRRSPHELSIEFYGWNFVDYRGLGSTEWRPLFGHLSTWVSAANAGIKVKRLERGQSGWLIRGAEHAERQRVRLARDIMLGVALPSADGDPRDAFRRPYYPIAPEEE